MLPEDEMRPGNPPCVIGPTEPLPADAKAGPRVAAYVGQIRVFVELAKSGSDVRRVMIHYEP